MKEFIEIIERIKAEIGSKNDYDVAEALDMKQNAFSLRKKRGSIPYEEIISFCDKINLSYDWVLCGIGPKYHLEPEASLLKESHQEYMVIDKYIKRILELIKDMDEDQKRGILYYIEREKQLSELIKTTAGEKQEEEEPKGARKKERRINQLKYSGNNKRKKQFAYKTTSKRH